MSVHKKPSSVKNLQTSNLRPSSPADGRKDSDVTVRKVGALSKMFSSTQANLKISKASTEYDHWKAFHADVKNNVRAYMFMETAGMQFETPGLFIRFFITEAQKLLHHYAINEPSEQSKLIQFALDEVTKTENPFDKILREQASKQTPLQVRIKNFITVTPKDLQEVQKTDASKPEGSGKEGSSKSSNATSKVEVKESQHSKVDVAVSSKHVVKNPSRIPSAKTKKKLDKKNEKEGDKKGEKKTEKASDSKVDTVKTEKNDKKADKDDKNDKKSGDKKDEKHPDGSKNKEKVKSKL